MALCGLAAFALYVSTLCRHIYWYDSAELVAASLTFGIPHPPGFPLYTLLGYVLCKVSPLDGPWTIGLMGASFGAGTVALSYRLQRALGATRSGAVLGAAALAGVKIFWENARAPEVYTPALFVMLLVLFGVNQAYRQRRPWRNVGWALLAGLGLGFHLSPITIGIGLGWLVAVSAGRVSDGSLKRRLLRVALVGGASGIAAAAGACVYFVLMWRAQANPAINFGNPQTLEALWWVVSGGQFKHWFVDTPFWPRLKFIAELLHSQLVPGALGVAVLGLVRLWTRRRRVAAVAFVLAILGNVAFFFRYNVHDLEVFFQPTLLLVSCLGGLGVDQVVSSVRCWWPWSTRVLGSPRRWLCPAVGVVLWVRGAGLFPQLDLSEYTAARDFGERLVRDLPRNSVIITYTLPGEWKYSKVFVDYYQLALGLRPDVTVQTQPHAHWVNAVIAAGNPIFAFKLYAQHSVYKWENWPPGGPDMARLVPPPPPSARGRRHRTRAVPRR